VHYDLPVVGLLMIGRVSPRHSGFVVSVPLHCDVKPDQLLVTAVAGASQQRCSPQQSNRRYQTLSRSGAAPWWVSSKSTLPPVEPMVRRYRVAYSGPLTTCLEKQEKLRMSGNLTAVSEMLGKNSVTENCLQLSSV